MPAAKNCSASFRVDTVMPCAPEQGEIARSGKDDTIGERRRQFGRCPRDQKARYIRHDERDDDCTRAAYDRGHAIRQRGEPESVAQAQNANRGRADGEKLHRNEGERLTGKFRRNADRLAKQRDDRNRDHKSGDGTNEV